MPNWTASFHLPKFSDDKFEKQREAYIKKNGYQVTIPDVSDVIHIKPFTPLNEEETKLWTGKKKVTEIPYSEMTPEDITYYMKKQHPRPGRLDPPTKAEEEAYRDRLKARIPEERRQEITDYKKKMHSKYMAMLASPSPKIIRDAGAILTALDDLQDAVSTLATIGLVAATLIGGTTAAVLAGPLGWIVAAGTIMQLINPYSRLRGGGKKKMASRKAKRELEKFTSKNPFAKSARLKVADTIKNFRPSKGNLIEGLQVTDQIFGVGVSIGPLMGFAQDVVAGAVRKVAGQKVKMAKQPLELPRYAKQAHRGTKAAAIFMGTKWESDKLDESLAFIALNLSHQALEPYVEDFNALKEQPDLASLELEAPTVDDPIIREIILESGNTIESAEIWPQNGKRWISYGELMDSTADQASANLGHFARQNKNDPLAYAAAQNAHDFTLGILDTFTGPGNVEYEYSHAERTVITILLHGWEYPDNITEAQVTKFEDWVHLHERMGTQPSARDIYRYAETFCGFTWKNSPEGD